MDASEFGRRLRSRKRKHALLCELCGAPAAREHNRFPPRFCSRSCRNRAYFLAHREAIRARRRARKAAGAQADLAGRNSRAVTPGAGGHVKAPTLPVGGSRAAGLDIPAGRAQHSRGRPRA